MSSFFFRSYLSQRSINPLDEWEILREQIEYEGELGRGAFGAVYKAMHWERVGIEVFSTEILKRNLLSGKTEPQVVAVAVLVSLKTKLILDHTNNSKKMFSFSRYITSSRQVFRNYYLCPRYKNRVATFLNE